MDSFKEKVLDNKVKEIASKKNFFEGSDIPNLFFNKFFTNISESIMTGKKMLFMEENNNIFEIYEHKAMVNKTNTLFYYVNKNNEKNGLVQCISKHSITRSLFYLKNNIPHGVFTFFYSNGNKMLEIDFKDGLVEGKANEYRIDGFLIRSSSYTNSKLNGLRTIYTTPHNYINIYYNDGIPDIEEEYQNSIMISQKKCSKSDVYKYFRIDGTIETEKYDTRLSTKVEPVREIFIEKRNRMFLESLEMENSQNSTSENSTSENEEINVIKPRKYKKSNISKRMKLA